MERIMISQNLVQLDWHNLFHQIRKKLQRRRDNCFYKKFVPLQTTACEVKLYDETVGYVEPITCRGVFRAQ